MVGEVFESEETSLTGYAADGGCYSGLMSGNFARFCVGFGGFLRRLLGFGVSCTAWHLGLLLDLSIEKV